LEQQQATALTNGTEMGGSKDHLSGQRWAAACTVLSDDEFLGGNNFILIQRDRDQDQYL
jgi:hypothetical protein